MQEVRTVIDGFPNYNRADYHVSRLFHMSASTTSAKLGNNLIRKHVLRQLTPPHEASTTLIELNVILISTKMPLP